MYMARNFRILIALLATLTMIALDDRLMSNGATTSVENRWEDARATFYGGYRGEETMQGACGYDNLFKQCYDLETAALSTALFNNGATCGACFEVRCVNSPQWCIKGAGSIIVTATNFCPPNFTKTVDIWCNPPQKHFDLTIPMFLKIAKYKAGVVPVKYKRVVCPKKQGGVKFRLTGNPYFLMVIVFNVGRDGVVVEVKIKGSKTDWLTMKRNWGQVWDTGKVLTGQSLSFKVGLSDGKRLEFDNVVPSNWQFNQTYDGNINF